MHIFEIQKRLVTDVGTFDSKAKKKSANSEVQWGTLYQNEAAKLRSQEIKKLRKLEKKEADGKVDEIADKLNAVALNLAPPVKVFAPNQSNSNLVILNRMAILMTFLNVL